MTLTANVAAAEPRGAVCRISNWLTSSSNIGSGTLVDKTDDGHEGLVLTCAHLFSEGVGNIVVAFSSGKSHGAKLVAIDREADLAALAITNPAADSAAISFQLRQAQMVRACGFGPHGEYACAEGPVVGEATDAGQMSVMIGDAVRSGDSGGGVFDAEGNLVAVVWGEAGGVTYASTGPPLRSFLDRVLGRRTAYVYNCPGGMCPRPLLGGGANSPPLTPLQTPPAEAGSPRLDELSRRVAALEQNKQDRGDYVTYDELGQLASRAELGRLELANNESYASLLATVQALRPALGPVVSHGTAGLLGITGPAGWALLAATSVGGWLVGRLMKRGAGGRREETFRG